MSSLKAGQGLSQYLKTRGEAEALVKASALDWTIYQPSVIFGAGDGLVSRFASCCEACRCCRWRVPARGWRRPGSATWPRRSPAALPATPCGQRRSFELYGPEVLTPGRDRAQDPRCGRSAHADHFAARQPRPAAGASSPNCCRANPSRSTISARCAPTRSARSTAMRRSASCRSRSPLGCRPCSCARHGRRRLDTGPLAAYADPARVQPAVPGIRSNARSRSRFFAVEAARSLSLPQQLAGGRRRRWRRCFRSTSRQAGWRRVSPQKSSSATHRGFPGRPAMPRSHDR